MDGLEIKAQLGSVWKQNLTELSGGQRWVHSTLSLHAVISNFLPTDTSTVN
jgi:hypothetical protein